MCAQLIPLLLAEWWKVDLLRTYSLKKIKVYNRDSNEGEFRDRLSKALIQLLDQHDNILAQHQAGDLSETVSIDLGADDFTFYFKIDKSQWKQHFGTFNVGETVQAKQCRGADEIKTGKMKLLDKAWVHWHPSCDGDDMEA